jgi:hypothetical protein
MDKITDMNTVYLLDVKTYKTLVEGTKFEGVDPTELSDKDFIDHAEPSEYTLEEFEEMFNIHPEHISPDNYYMRIVTKKSNSPEFWKARYEVQKELTEAKEQELNDLKEDAKNVIAKIRELANKHNLWKL